MAERTVITQELCRKAQIMLAGADVQEVADLLGIGASTLRRIRRCNFSAEEYRKNLDARKEPKEKPEEKQAEEQVPGQISMELPQKEEKPDMSEAVKMMRFLAGQFDKLYMMMNTINDNICQMLRMMQK